MPMLGDEATGLPGWAAAHEALAFRPPLGRVAEWQTRWLQVPVRATSWGFKSPLAHRLWASLRRNPAVALTIDTEVHPPKILLLRGEAVLDEVEGIPDEYLQMNGTYEMTAEQRAEWETEVRSLYDSMVRIVVKPTWAKLIDFHETLPSAVEELIRRRQERQEP